MCGQQARIGHVIRHLAQTIHVVGKGDQASGRPARQHFIGAPYQRGAQDFLKCADMRQARGAIAGLEHHRCAARLATGKALDQLACLIKRPGLRDLGRGNNFGGFQNITHPRPFRQCGGLAQAGSWSRACALPYPPSRRMISACGLLARISSTVRPHISCGNTSQSLVSWT